MSQSFSLQALAELAGARLRGDGGLPIVGVAALETAGALEIALFHQPRYREAFAQTRAGAVVVRAKTAEELPDSPVALLIADDPPLAFARISAALHPAAQAVPGVDARAFVHPSAQVDPSAEVAPFAFVGAGAQVGARSAVMAFAYVGPNSRVGSDCRLHPSAVVAEGCLLGDRVILQAGAVVGSDGFGYAFDAAVPAHRKVPQIGTVRLEDDVEIGANSCVDRATLGETVIGRGSKLDNQVQVAHNVRVGPLSILCAQVGIAGSTTVGQGVVMAGQVGVVGHIQVGDGAKIGAQAGVMTDVPAGQTQTGAPARPHVQFMRQMAAEQRLPEALRRLAALEKRVAELTLSGANAHSQSEPPVRKNEP